MTQLQYAFLLIAIFQLKQFVADFPLQTSYMLQKTRTGWAFLLPLTLHCMVHALATLALCLWLKPSLAWLSLLDFGSHFIMDRIKADGRLLGRFKLADGWVYWSVFGFDQMVHHLTHLVIVYLIVVSP